ncbi:MAG: D-hexose-6-phosphate mutarotase [Lentisphaerae bacterium]|nr:D-hexose-6-phosphate mutarotase [Lentisphaerota bacterium]
MTTTQIDMLNARYGIPGALAFEGFHGAFVMARIRNEHATAEICLHGAHVMAYQPHGQAPVLWMSAHSKFEANAPIRGGIPICWPWFGKHPQDPDCMPFHGFARLADWSVCATRALADGSTQLDLQLPASAPLIAMWPEPWELRLQVTVGKTLRVALTMCNSGDVVATHATALHTYFTVGDVTAVRVLGLEGCRYLDTLTTPPAMKTQAGAVTVGEEVDRAYVDTEATCTIEDPSMGRRIRIAKEGSRSTVVWNPWIAKSARMPDFGDTEYPGMICVETVNTATDVRVVAPGATHCIAATISVEPLT